MKNPTIAAVLALSLSGCVSAIYGDGEQIGTVGGKALFQSTCTVDLSTAGQQGLFGTGTIPLYGTCEVAAENRCGDAGFAVENVDRSNRRRMTEQIQNGPYLQTRSFIGEDVVLSFTCNA